MTSIQDSQAGFLVAHNLWLGGSGFLNGTGQAADVRSLLTDADRPDAVQRVFLTDLWTHTSGLILSVSFEMENEVVPLLFVYRL